MPLPDSPVELAAVLIELRLRKPVDSRTWVMVETSYMRNLALERLAAARERSARLEPGGTIAP